MSKIPLFILISLLSLNVFSQNLSKVKGIQNIDGQVVNFKNLIENKTAVFVFYSTDCPICIKYTKTINEINELYSDKCPVYLVFSGNHQSKQLIEAFNKKYNVTAKALLDPKFKLSKKSEASITPEVLLTKYGEIIYKGAIDDWVIKLGATKTEPRNHYLINAIDAASENNTIDPSSTKAIGCFIR